MHFQKAPDWRLSIDLARKHFQQFWPAPALPGFHILYFLSVFEGKRIGKFVGWHFGLVILIALMVPQFPGDAEIGHIQPASVILLLRTGAPEGEPGPNPLPGGADEAARHLHIFPAVQAIAEARHDFAFRKARIYLYACPDHGFSVDIREVGYLRYLLGRVFIGTLANNILKFCKSTFVHQPESGIIITHNRHSGILSKAVFMRNEGQFGEDLETLLRKLLGEQVFLAAKVLGRKLLKYGEKTDSPIWKGIMPVGRRNAGILPFQI